MAALQASAFVTVGRIFDQNSRHNIDRLVKIAQSNLQLFSKDALAARKQDQNAAPPVWLDEYLRNAYVPNARDFRRVRMHVAKWRRVYEEKYRAIRHEVFAHRAMADQAEISALFAKTNIGELARLLIFLVALYDCLWQLYMNGRKPSLRLRPYSVQRIRRKPSPGTKANAVHERVVREVEQFLCDATREPPDSVVKRRRPR